MGSVQATPPAVRPNSSCGRGGEAKAVIFPETVKEAAGGSPRTAHLLPAASHLIGEGGGRPLLAVARPVLRPLWENAAVRYGWKRAGLLSRRPSPRT